MNLLSYLDIKTKVEIILIIIALVLLILVISIMIVTAVIQETSITGGCKKIPYGPGFEGRCDNGYYVVSILDKDGVLRNPDSGPASGYMICCRAE